MHDFINDLNDVQREAVTCTEGPSLVIAGAGSGKTRVLTYRIAFLLSQGVNPRSILALTFTNKAAKEMRERIGRLIGTEAAAKIWMGTFHSIFARILRQEAQNIGFESNFTIYDPSDCKSLIKTILKEMNLDDQIYKVNEVYSRISSAKNDLITPHAYLSNQKLMMEDSSSRKPRIADIYKLYMQRCKKAGSMDFDDLLLYTNVLFRDFPEVIEKYSNMFRYIMVDEYQDTNNAQYLIIKRLASKHRNICVVGDDAQSIYGFRGARIENILNFEKDYKDYKLFKLEQNYRSTQTIVNAAGSLIAKNKAQIKKQAFSENETGKPIRVFETNNDQEEGFVVTRLLMDTQADELAAWSDFAILYRTNAQSRIFEEALRKRSVPYKIYGGLSFYQRKEIKDLLAYCRLVINEKDDEALKRIINYPTRGIGNTSIERIEQFANQHDASMWQTLTNEQALAEAGLKGAAIGKVQSFVNLISGFRSQLGTENAYELVYAIANGSGIIRDLKSETTVENISKLENLEELLNSIKEFVESNSGETLITLDLYLENVALLTDVDNEKDEDRNKVTLMTIHSAKGLEFKYVFIVGLEENLFPSQMTMSSQQDLEEERRLFYVALTRAERRAVLSYAKTRYKWGTVVNSTPSRFINEIDRTYLELPDDEAGGWKNEERMSRAEETSPLRFIRKQTFTTPSEKLSNFTRKPQSASAPATLSQLVPGAIVEHERFGIGEIVELEGEKATVVFRENGTKQLLLKFARLRVL